MSVASRAMTTGVAAVGCTLVALGVTCGTIAHAQTGPPTYATFRLAAEGADSCPDEERLRELVAAHLGYDPFVETASLTVAVALERDGGSLRARIDVADATSQRQGHRELTSTDETCRELADSVALALALVIDPRAAATPRTATAPIRTVAPVATASTLPVTLAAGATSGRISRRSTRTAAPAAVRTTPARREPRQSEGVGIVLGAGVSGSVGSAPAPSIGGRATVGVRRAMGSIALDGRMDLAAATRREDGSGVEASLVSVALVGCAHVEPFAFCALAAAGALRGRGVGIADARDDTSAYAAVGARGGVEMPLIGPIRVNVYAELLGPLTPTTLHIDGQERWSTPALSASVAATVSIALRP